MYLYTIYLYQHVYTVYIQNTDTCNSLFKNISIQYIYTHIFYTYKFYTSSWLEKEDCLHQLPQLAHVKRGTCMLNRVINETKRGRVSGAKSKLDSLSSSKMKHQEVSVCVLGTTETPRLAESWFDKNVYLHWLICRCVFFLFVSDILHHQAIHTSSTSVVVVVVVVVAAALLSINSLTESFKQLWSWDLPHPAIPKSIYSISFPWSFFVP